MMLASPPPYYYGEGGAVGGPTSTVGILNAAAPAYDPGEGNVNTTLEIERQSQGYYYGMPSSTAASGASAAYFYPGMVS